MYRIIKIPIVLSLFFLSCENKNRHNEQKMSSEKDSLYEIYFSEFDVAITEIDSLPSKYIFKNNKCLDSLIIYLENKLGKSMFIGYKKGQVLCSGGYDNSPKLLETFIYKEDISTGKGENVLHNYYQPMLVKSDSSNCICEGR